MTRTVTIGHTPDMDDAFMFHALAEGHVVIEGVKIQHVIEDIQTLNQRALNAELDVTACSAASYPLIAKDYWILSVGSSVGQGYGPLVVSLKPRSPEELAGARIAVPGQHTTAYFLLKLAVPNFQPVSMSFEQISEAVLRGNVDAGLLIHERQLTYRDQGLLPVLDLGIWWKNQTRLPLPLGLNVAKRTLGKPLAAKIAQGLRESIVYGMTHQDQVVTASMKYGRGIDLSRARQFVNMYVNEETLALSQDSRKALRTLYHRALELELISSAPRSLIVIQPSKA